MTATATMAAPDWPKRRADAADWLAVALAASLPWSTSATAILVGLWLVAALSSLRPVDLRHALFSAAGGLPVLLWLVGVIGMAWADVPWDERLEGLSGFHKLLAIPLLLAHARRSKRTTAALVAFVVSCTALLATSWIVGWFGLTPPGKNTGIPVKDYISQSAMFVICIFTLMHLSIAAWALRRHARATGYALLALAFAFNIFVFATSRTALVVIPVLLVAYGLLRLRWRGILVLSGLLVAVVVVAWMTSPFLQSRVTTLVEEVRGFKSEAASTSAGERLEYWRKSAQFIADAPLIGHGTGSIRDQFTRVVGDRGMSALVADNPHNQTLAVAIPLGLMGAIVLWALWIAHARMFAGASLVHWVGLVVVLQNVVGSLFNSHLFDFTHGWLYVVGVGLAGGTVLQRRAGDPVSKTEGS